MPATTPTVYVLDGDPSVRRSLDPLIRGAGWLPEAFALAREFLARPRALAPSCLVLDASLPDVKGLDVQALLAERTETPVIFVTRDGDVETTVRAMKAGAVEVLTKPLREDALIGALRHALDRSRAALAKEAQLQRLRECYAQLSPREREVMALVVTGRLNKQVGGELGISEITVKAHRAKMMRKMNANSLADLIMMALRLRVSAMAEA